MAPLSRTYKACGLRLNQIFLFVWLNLKHQKMLTIKICFWSIFKVLGSQDCLLSWSKWHSLDFNLPWQHKGAALVMQWEIIRNRLSNFQMLVDLKQSRISWYLKTIYFLSMHGRHLELFQIIKCSRNVLTQWDWEVWDWWEAYLWGQSSQFFWSLNTPCSLFWKTGSLLYFFNVSSSWSVSAVKKSNAS